ncbi:MAG: hypothetical protein GX639_12885 [Fibrobacter sp.]|nr:hypothetical protein [Fibrobacter sp.]
MANAVIERTSRFRWNSKSSLYDYFHKYYDMGRDVIDDEISNSMKTFKPRQGQPVRTAELWQKVGIILEKNNDVVRELPEEAYDSGIVESYVVNEHESEGERNLFTLTDPDQLSVNAYSARDFIFRKKRV